MYIYNLQKISCLKWNHFVWIFVYIFEDYSDLTHTFSKHWMIFLSNFVSLVTYWSYIFLLDVSSFTSDEEKEGKNKFFNYFWRMLLKFEEKKFEIHELSQLLITWIPKELKSYKPLLKIFQKSNYLAGTFWVVKPI